MKFKEFLKVCHEKEVFKKLSLYVVFIWVLIQVISTIWEPMGLPKDTISFSIIIMVISFPVYIYYIWKTHLKNIYSVKNKRLKVEDREKTGKSHLNFQSYYFVSLGIISFISGLLVVLVFYNKFSGISISEEIQYQDKIAVLKFANKTGGDDLDIDARLHGVSLFYTTDAVTDA